jgi:hypothetical protein
VKSNHVSTGITGTYRVTLTDGRLTHDASVQTIDEAKTTYQTREGPSSISGTPTFITWQPTSLIS